jgi:hypothetical protein
MNFVLLHFLLFIFRILERVGQQKLLSLRILLGPNRLQKREYGRSGIFNEHSVWLVKPLSNDACLVLFS